jgi:hypothetical protein
MLQQLQEGVALLRHVLGDHHLALALGGGGDNGILLHLLLVGARGVDRLDLTLLDDLALLPCACLAAVLRAVVVSLDVDYIGLLSIGDHRCSGEARGLLIEEELVLHLLGDDGLGGGNIREGPLVVVLKALLELPGPDIGTHEDLIAMWR